jgi:hypothetical protein
MSDFDINKFFFAAQSVPDKKVVGRIAINEEGVSGFIVKVKAIGTTKIYVGVELGTGTEWVSLNPAVLNERVGSRATVEMFYVIQDLKKKDLMSKVDISISPPLTGGADFTTAMDPSNWKKISFDEDGSGDLKDFLEKFLFPGSPPPSDNLYSENDFKIDNEEEDRDNL